MPGGTSRAVTFSELDDESDVDVDDSDARLRPFPGLRCPEPILYDSSTDGDAFCFLYIAMSSFVVGMRRPSSSYRLGSSAPVRTLRVLVFGCRLTDDEDDESEAPSTTVAVATSTVVLVLLESESEVLPLVSLRGGVWRYFADALAFAESEELIGLTASFTLRLGRVLLFAPRRFCCLFLVFLRGDADRDDADDPDEPEVALRAFG